MVQHALGLDFAGALAFVAGDEAVPARAPATPAPKPADAADERRRIGRAREIWIASVEPRGTIAEAYLNSRELDLDADLANRVLRFNPRCPWRDEATGLTIFVPALIAVLRSITTDEITAIQRTRLSPEGLKLDRWMLGNAAGSAIKLDADDAVCGGLHVGEGTETTMTGRQMGLRPAWALGSSGAIASFPVLAGVECLTILAETGQASAAAVEACGTRWTKAGLEVLVNRPRFGSDLNDALTLRETL